MKKCPHKNQQCKSTTISYNNQKIRKKFFFLVLPYFFFKKFFLDLRPHTPILVTGGVCPLRAYVCMHFCCYFLLFVFFCALRRYFFFCVPLCHSYRKSRLKLKRRRKNAYFCVVLTFVCFYCVFSSVCLSVCLLFAIFACPFFAQFAYFVQFCPIYIICRKKVLLFLLFFY